MTDSHKRLSPAAQLVMEVARIHDERRQNLTVIPIAVDIDSPVPELLSALMNAYSGLYIDVDADVGLPFDKPATRACLPYRW